MQEGDWRAVGIHSSRLGNKSECQSNSKDGYVQNRASRSLKKHKHKGIQLSVTFKISTRKIITSFRKMQNDNVSYHNCGIRAKEKKITQERFFIVTVTLLFNDWVGEVT